MASKVSIINIEGLEQARGRLVGSGSHREVPNVVGTELAAWASHATKSRRAWRLETPYTHSKKSEITRPLYAIATPSSIFLCHTQDDASGIVIPQHQFTRQAQPPLDREAVALREIRAGWPPRTGGCAVRRVYVRSLAPCSSATLTSRSMPAFDSVEKRTL